MDMILRDTHTGKTVKTQGKTTELLQKAMAETADSPAHKLAGKLLGQQQTALVEQGLELGSQYQISHAEQAKIAEKIADHAVSDREIGELERLLRINIEDGSKMFAGKSNYDTIQTDGAEPFKQIKEQNMPHYAEARTPVEKFVNYSLNYSNKNAAGKAEAYERGLGYTQENADGLIRQIHDAVISGETVPFQISSSEYGTKYKYRIAVTGPNGKTKNVIAVYQVDIGSNIPRLITNYLEGK